MKKITHFTANNRNNIRLLLQSLHSFFSYEIKVQKINRYGISFPKIDLHHVGLHIDVYCPEDVDMLLSHKPLNQLMSSGLIKLEGIQLIQENEIDRYVAFIRDRRLERGAPPQAMARMQSSNHKYKDAIAQATMSRYFEHSLPQINMASRSNNRNFTLNIATVEANDNELKEVLLKPSSFNSYGLSSYADPVFLPMVFK